MRLIDADALPKWTGYALSAAEIAIEVEHAPTIDAVPVVRCKDCKNRPMKRNPIGNDYGFNLYSPTDDEICPCIVGDNWYSWMPQDNFYCAYGERKDSNV